MRKPIFLVAGLATAAAAAAAFFLRKKKPSELWDTASSWGESAASKAEEVAETVAHAGRDAAKKV
jgi:hypothetical protein